MKRLSLQKRVQIIQMLTEGNSMRAAARMAGVTYNSVSNVLVTVGEAASEYQHRALRNLPCKKFQVDEIWSFCYAKQKNIGKLKNPKEESGDCWTWVALCPDTKLVPTWLVSQRTSNAATKFIRDLSHRVDGRIQITSDGYKPYENAINTAFGSEVDYAQVVKMYDGRQRYIGSERRVLIGNPAPEDISTSLVERQNLTMRMGIRRFTRDSNGFSKKIENHSHAVSLHFLYYNFCRVHSSLRVTPAMEAGISDHVWSIEEILFLVKEEAPKPRGAYKMKEKDVIAYKSLMNTLSQSRLLEY